MTKEYTYTYTRTIEIDFDDLVYRYGINDEDNLKEECRILINTYVNYLEDVKYWLLINHVDEIANDLYNYLQSKK